MLPNTHTHTHKQEMLLCVNKVYFDYKTCFMQTHTHTQQWDEPRFFSKTILSQFCKLQNSSIVTYLYPCKTLGPCNTFWINIESIILNSEKVPYIHI